MSKSNGRIIDAEVIDIRPPRRSRKVWLVFALVALVFLLLTRGTGIYVESLWFDALGYSQVYWYGLQLKVVLFLVFAVATIAILRFGFYLLERFFKIDTLARRVVMINDQPLSIAPARAVKPIAWTLAIVFGIGYGLIARDEWLTFAKFLHTAAAATSTEVDPVFNQPLAFYFFSYPVYTLIAAWLTTLLFIILGGAVLLAVISSLGDLAADNFTGTNLESRRTGFAVVSFVFALVLLVLAWRTYLSRYAYLWQDHEVFSGVTYTEANYVLPGLIIVTITLVIAALLLLANAFVWRSMRPLLVALALPIAVYFIAVVIVPGSVNRFIVKPNELQQETPYIENNLQATRRAFALDRIESRDFAAETSIQTIDLQQNRQTLDNLRLWDWRALQDTLRQMQQIRTYYDFPDVDVDRYTIGGQTQQMMIAARELDINKLPASSRNWPNERLIYTHGYGVTMNTANGFTPEGRPRFVLSNMPIESQQPDLLRITRPQIYFGQLTNTDVYVKTRQREFDYPQGETQATTTYEGSGGIPVGSGLRRLLLAWTLGDMAKLPFSNDVTPESQILMRRNIEARLQQIAPFLVYDKDPYIVVGQDGGLHWIIDAYTEAQTYPLARHYDAAGNFVNYLRNSVKATINAYDGSVKFYVFDSTDVIASNYRRIFPALFLNADQMPADLRAHVRYPETLIRTQAEVYGLYHASNAKTFFQREDVWSVAQDFTATSTNAPNSSNPISNQAQPQQQTSRPLDPYYVLLQLPGATPTGNANQASASPAAPNAPSDQYAGEYVGVVPFTPANRNNLIGWVAGRSDGAAYGSLVVYRFPQSRLVDGPLQIKARTDQNAQLSGQLTLWNQQGSRVQRGNVLVIPIGRGLLYCEPIFLQAERSPMPELRLVVLATQERISYGTNFEEALNGLFGGAASTSPSTTTAAAAQTADTSAPASSSTTSATAPPATTQIGQSGQTTQELIKRAAGDLEAYQRLTAEGKLGEAGQRLESLKRVLDQLQNSK